MFVGCSNVLNVVVSCFQLCCVFLYTAVKAVAAHWGCSVKFYAVHVKKSWLQPYYETKA